MRLMRRIHPMRLITPRNAGPARVNMYLLPQEHQAITFRQHPARLLPPAATAMGGLLAAVIVTAALHISWPVRLTVWVLTAFLFVECLAAVLRWAESFTAVTAERIVLVFGVLNRRVAMIPISSITDMTFDRSSSGSMLGYGQFIIQSSQGRSIIDYVPYPEQLYLELIALAFPAEMIPCPQCDGQGVLIQRDEDGNESNYLCPLCKGRKTTFSGAFTAENRAAGDA